MLALAGWRPLVISMGEDWAGFAEEASSVTECYELLNANWGDVHVVPL